MGWQVEHCVQDCTHHFWGGDGYCTAGHHECACDAGYSSYDSLGRPSCVPLPALRAGYLTVAAVSWVSLICLLWHAARYRRLPVQTRGRRRSELRLRIMVCSIGLSVGSAIVFLTFAVNAGYDRQLDNALRTIYYSAIFPLAIFAVMMTAELWLESLPSKILSVSSRTAKLKELAERRHIFAWSAGLCTTATMCCGATYVYFPRITMALVHGISAATTFVTVSCTIAVAGEVIAAINRSSHQARGNVSKASRDFYSKAKNMIRVQVSILALAGMLIVVAVCALHFPRLGSETPLFPLVVQICSTVVGLTVVVHFSGPTRKVAQKQQSSAMRSARLASAIVAPGSGGNLTHGQHNRSKKRSVETITRKKSVRKNGLPIVHQKSLVVPTIIETSALLSPATLGASDATGEKSTVGTEAGVSEVGSDVLGDDDFLPAVPTESRHFSDCSNNSPLGTERIPC